MDDYLRNTLFVEDLLEFLYNLEEIEWKAKGGVRDFKHELGKSPFDPAIGNAVDKLCEVFHDELKESYCILIGKGIKDKAAFKKYALMEARDCFTQGYTHEHFLAYCVQVLGIPGMYYYPSLSDIVDSAAHVVALVLFSHQMTGEFYRLGGWSGLSEVARKIDDCLSYCNDTDGFGNMRYYPSLDGIVDSEFQVALVLISHLYDESFGSWSGLPERKLRIAFQILMTQRINLTFLNLCRLKMQKANALIFGKVYFDGD